MNPIEFLEAAIKEEEERLEDYLRDIKTFKNEVVMIEAKAKEAISHIAGLRDALHKLKGLAELERKAKIAAGAGSVTYEEYEKEKKRRG